VRQPHHAAEPGRTQVARPERKWLKGIVFDEAVAVVDYSALNGPVSGNFSGFHCANKVFDGKRRICYTNNDELRREGA
jgi:hypothetical protein